MSLIYEVNNTHVTTWPESIGKLIMNFSALEMETYQWLTQLSDGAFAIAEIDRHISFKQRVDMIKVCIDDRAFNEAWQINSENLWASAVELAKLRNRMAHNPLTYSWGAGTQEGPPPLMGIVEIFSKDSSAVNTVFLPLAEINSAVDKTIEIVHRLSELRTEWCNARDNSYSQLSIETR